MDESFGTALRRLRHDKGMTQESLARAAGVSYRTIHRLESGDHQPSGTTRARLVEALGVADGALP